MHRIEILGTPIGGEDSRERNWTEQIAAACRSEAAYRLEKVILRFTISRARKNPDLDNLIRPATKGLREAGWLSRRFVALDSILATKEFGPSEGLVVESGVIDLPGDPELDVRIPTLPVGDRWTEWQRSVTTDVAEAWQHDPVEVPVFVHFEIDSRHSLVDRMKPLQDCLEPYLGRDPNGRTEFCPNDHLIEWVCFSRANSPEGSRLRAGRMLTNQ